MRFLHVAESVSSISGGLQNTVLGFASGLKKQNHDVVVYTGMDHGSMVDIPGLDVFRLKLFGLYKINFLKGLFSKIREYQPDVVIQHGIWSGLSIQVTAYCKLLKIPYVVVPHGMLDPYILRKNSLEKKLALMFFQKVNLDNASFIRVLNENEAKHVSEVTKNKVAILPNGLNEFLGYSPSSARQFDFSFLGRIDHKKGVLELLEGWRLFKEKTTNRKSFLKIAGWGGDDGYMEIFRKKISELPDVEYVGPIFGDEKNEFLRNSKFFILPSRGEGLPTAILEAWDAGCVVVMTKDCNFDPVCFQDAAIECYVDPESIEGSFMKCLALSDKEIASYQQMSKIRLNSFNWSEICNEFTNCVLTES